jgi:hypothetical protein
VARLRDQACALPLGPRPFLIQGRIAIMFNVGNAQPVIPIVFAVGIDPVGSVAEG